MIAENEGLLKGFLLCLKILAVFFLLRAALFLAGFRYTIPLIDDFFWYVYGHFLSWISGIS